MQLQKSILNRVNQEFINTHLDGDLSQLLFKKHNDITIDIKLLISQIESKKRCFKKLPTWFKKAGIIYPNKLNIEQTSSEVTAQYKASLAQGVNLVDLTGGFGVDAYYFSKNFDTIVHCEIDSDLSEIANHNFKQLDARNIHCEITNGLSYLKAKTDTYDWIYADPSRRHESKGKVFFLSDCLPNIPENLKLLYSKSHNILIKTSPLLDISIGIEELKNVKAIHIVAVNNEVKELLWVLEKNFNESVSIKAVNLKKDTTESFSFKFSEESSSEAEYEKPLKFLYEPNAAILKAGAFNILAKKFNLFKLNKHAHLYTSQELIEFPGRVFEVENVFAYNKKNIKKVQIKKANITTRHFPESVKKIRDKFGIKDGGENYLFFTTNNQNERIMIICKKPIYKQC